ncbi:hypothetical protein [Arthrobacter sp. SDTb3-6]|uniref:hypothetical protein n=1 Tax=Arthrobacter sp. SDTb3-6 TaxID=2713571 RepID=UPI00159D3664|nr:hypothetical protein [Arthrobacter sp. SDTb3-6]NVM97825.1 hypothetical protein [Arthrobacter sp. SDTb3-6]
MMFDQGETIVRLRRQMVADPYSGELTQGSWEAADELPIEGAAVAPSSTTEPASANRQMVITSMSVYGPPGMDVLRADRIRARSGLWEVAGENAAWVNPFTGWAPGDEFPLRKVAG